MAGPNFLCGLDAAVDVVGGKWKALILQLRELERDGIVHREVHEQVPPKVVYSLTEMGTALDKAMTDLGSWGEQHMQQIIDMRQTTRRQPPETGQRMPSRSSHVIGASVVGHTGSK